MRLSTIWMEKKHIINYLRFDILTFDAKRQKTSLFAIWKRKKNKFGKKNVQKITNERHALKHSRAEIACTQKYKNLRTRETFDSPCKLLSLRIHSVIVIDRMLWSIWMLFFIDSFKYHQLFQTICWFSICIYLYCENVSIIAFSSVKGLKLTHSFIHSSNDSRINKIKYVCILFYIWHTNMYHK